MKLKLLPTCDVNVFYCPKNRLMYARLLNKNNEIIYRELNEVITNKDKYTVFKKMIKENKKC